MNCLQKIKQVFAQIWRIGAKFKQKGNKKYKEYFQRTDIEKYRTIGIAIWRKHYDVNRISVHRQVQQKIKKLSDLP